MPDSASISLPRPAITVIAVTAVVAPLLAAAAAFGANAFFTLGFAIPAVLLGITCLQRPMVFVLGLFAWHTLAFVSSSTYFPELHYRLFRFAKFADEMLLIPLFVYAGLHFAFQRRLAPPRVVWLWAALVAVTLVSGYANDSGARKTLSYLQSYYRHVVLLVVCALCFRPSAGNYARVGRLLVAAVLVQFVFDTGWLLGINPIPNTFAGSQADWAIGTMGLSSFVTYLAVLVLCLGIAVFAESRAPGRRLAWAGIIAACLALFIYGNTKHAVPPAAASFAVVVALTSRRGLPVRLAILAMVTVLVVVVAERYNVPFRSRQTSWYQPDAILPNVDVKVQAHRDVARVLNEDRAWVLGKGPGQFSSAVASQNLSPLFCAYFYWEVEHERYNPYGSIMFYPRTGVLSLLGEVGLAGLVLYAVLCATVFLHILGQLRRGVYNASPWARHLAIAWCGWAVFYALLNVLTDYLNYNITPFITWAGAGILWNPPLPETPPAAPAPAGDPAA